MKSEFVSNVSRELRSPLTSIYGFAETLLRDDVLFGKEERTTFLSYIASALNAVEPIDQRVVRLRSADEARRWLDRQRQAAGSPSSSAAKLVMPMTATEPSTRTHSCSRE